MSGAKPAQNRSIADSVAHSYLRYFGWCRMRVSVLFAMTAAVAGIVCAVRARHSEPDERLAVIETTLREAAKTWTRDKGAHGFPCVKADVLKSTDTRDKLVVMRLSRASIPAPLTYCTNETDQSYYQIYQPEFGDNRAAISIDFHCGMAACGAGEDMMLNRINTEWKVADRRVTWMF